MFSHNFKRNDKKETMVEEAIPNYLRIILKLLMCNKFVLPVSKDFNSKYFLRTYVSKHFH